MVLKIKSWVLDYRDFFPKIIWVLPIKSQEIRSQELKSWRKSTTVLWKWALVWDVFIKRTFFLSICIWKYLGVFLISIALLFAQLQTSFVPIQIRRFCIKSYWNQKKVPENKVSKWQDFLPQDIFRIKDFIFDFFFRELFWRLPK